MTPPNLDSSLAPEPRHARPRVTRLHVAGMLLMGHFARCASPHAHAHAQHAHHDPLVHRFENAERWAQDFDAPTRDAWQRPAEVVALLAVTPGMVVADVGAGTGYFEPHLARAVGAGGSVLAVDIEPDMVRYLGERAAREHLDNVRPVLAATDDPRLPAAGVDRVLIVDTWHHIADRVAYGARLRAALRPGGLVAVVDFTLEAGHGPPPQHRLAPEAVVAELHAAGFDAHVADETLPDQYVVLAR